jgi:hypothetical protein
LGQQGPRQLRIQRDKQGGGREGGREGGGEGGRAGGRAIGIKRTRRRKGGIARREGGREGGREEGRRGRVNGTRDTHTNTHTYIYIEREREGGSKKVDDVRRCGSERGNQILKLIF